MRSKNIVGRIDIWLLIIYLALATIGLLSIYAAAYNEEHPHIYDLSQNYGKQLLFIGVSLVFGFAILLIDAKFFNAFAYVIYGLSILSLLLVLAVGYPRFQVRRHGYSSVQYRSSLQNWQNSARL